MGDQAGIRPVREHGGRGPRIPGTQRQGFLAQRVVGSPGGGYRRIGVAAGPRLYTGVDVHRTLFPAQLDESDARDLDRDVHQKIPAPEQRIQDAAEVLTGEGLLDDLDSQILGFLKAALVSRHDGDAVRSDTDVPEDERQDALANAAETDDQDATREFDVNFVIASHDPV